MSDPNPAEKPVNDGGTNAPQQAPDLELDSELDAEAVVAEKPANQGGSTS